MSAKLSFASLESTEPFFKISLTDIGVLDAKSKSSKTSPTTEILAKSRVSTNRMRRASPCLISLSKVVAVA